MSMRTFGELWRSTILTKWVMAITGVLIVLFLIGHLSGNLLVFVGEDAMNEYGVWLRSLGHGTLLWVVRLGLVAVFVLHVVSAIRLSAMNRAARPISYARTQSMKSTVASKTMLLSGLLILVYGIYHLAHFTWGLTNPDFYNQTDALGRHDVYHMVIASFREPVIVVIYLLAMVLTGLHLNHAISSAMQTLGVNHPKYVTIIRRLGVGLSIAIAVGFSSVPLGVVAGIVK